MGAITDTFAEELIIKSRVKTLMQLPFYGTLLCSLDYEEVLDKNEVDTMATDTKKIFYNPEFVKGLQPQEIVFVNAHEIMHVALGHPWRKGSRLHNIWNYACDYAINDLLKQTIDQNNCEHIMKMPEKVLYDKKYTGMCAEEIYDILIKQTKLDASKACKATSGDGDGIDCDGVDIPGLSDQQFDTHDKWDKPDVQKDKDDKVSEWEGKLADAVGKHAGTAPKGANRYVKQILEPKRDWREILHEFLSQEVTDYSFSPPDRRFSDTMDLCGLQFFLPDFNEMSDVANDLLVWIDTSGSIQEADIQEFYSELIGAMNQFGGRLNGHLGFFDSSLYGPHKFDSADDVLEIVPQGGGGTDFSLVLNKSSQIIENGELKVAGIIVFTDGYCGYPERNPVDGTPLLWAMTTDEQAPYGITTSLRDRNK